MFQAMGVINPQVRGSEPVALGLRGRHLWGSAGSRKGEYPGGLSVTFIA